jgi:hypothetical protein
MTFPILDLFAGTDACDHPTDHRVEFTDELFDGQVLVGARLVAWCDRCRTEISNVENPTPIIDIGDNDNG